MTKAIGRENSQGQINVTITCDCGSPITHTTASGMHCSNPNCNLEQISDNMTVDTNTLFNNFDENDPFGSLDDLIKKFSNIQTKLEEGKYDPD